ncbi:MAG: diguanylate cyclase [Clostridia bacterium]|nr:diguanylate cyclase [Clostridia bacterium]
MFKEIYIIDCENELVMMLREKFEKQRVFKFKNIKPCNLDIALKGIPDLIIINEKSIDTEIIELCQKIRQNDDNTITPVLVISSTDDEEHKLSIMKNHIEYIVPDTVSNEYLYYTIKNIIRLLSINRTVSPLTGLPGNVQILAELKKRLLRKETFQVLYLDLDNFKAYNDVYGFLKGDEIIKLTAKIITKNVHALEEADVFVGHIGGDDFVAIVDENVDHDKICQNIIAEFDKEVLKYFNDTDVEQGYIEVCNRKGIIEEFPLTSISIGVVVADKKRFANILEIGEVGAQVKHLAKTTNGSSYAINRREEY